VAVADAKRSTKKTHGDDQRPGRMPLITSVRGGSLMWTCPVDANPKGRLVLRIDALGELWAAIDTWPSATPR
jgi:hypothetical protein